jgi:hypothetical protein
MPDPAWEPQDDPPPHRLGIGCLLAMIVSSIGTVVMAVLAVLAIARAFAP